MVTASHGFHVPHTGTELWDLTSTVDRSIIIDCWTRRGFATTQILYLDVYRSLNEVFAHPIKRLSNNLT